MFWLVLALFGGMLLFKGVTHPDKSVLLNTIVLFVALVLANIAFVNIGRNIERDQWCTRMFETPHQHEECVKISLWEIK